MVALQIRNVPDDVRDALAEQASAQGQSLQAYLLTLVTKQAKPNRNRDILKRISEELKNYPESDITPEHTLAILDRARAEHDAKNMALLTD